MFIYANVIGKNVLTTKGAIHYLRNEELEENENYLKNRISKEKIVSMIVGGPNKYYDYNDDLIDRIFFKIDTNFIKNGYQLIFMPSMRTPTRIIEKAQKYFSSDEIIVDNIDKKAYLSALKLADHIIVMCDSTSMISEAAMTGKPIYVAQMKPIRENKRFKSFFKLFKSLNIIKDLENTIEEWQYEKLYETDKISNYIKNKIKNYDFS